MKAVTRSRYGGPEKLEIAEVAAPTPEADEVLLHVEAVSVNAGDWHLLRGSPLFIRLLYGGLLRPNTAILGMDVAGRVAEVGTDVTRLDLEDRVFGALPDGVLGGFAEQAKAPADTLVPIPAGVSVEAAAAVPTTGMSALQALRAASDQRRPYRLELVTPYLTATSHPHGDDQSVPWWWGDDPATRTDNRDKPTTDVPDLRRRDTRLVADNRIHRVETIDHGQVVTYAGDDPVQTAKNGIRRIGTHGRFGFGELRLRPPDCDRVSGRQTAVRDRHRHNSQGGPSL